ncbi:juvenile hormone esterase-like [Ostrinia nubilalis]|uniref:juvenile hormone esterase-like n=1 Tax=Ostrinia nubilalis TaxID=29057 RepID=UPI0030822F54
MSTPKVLILALVYFAANTVCADPDLSGCEVAVKIEQGHVCGRRRRATNGEDYASFRGIPYAKQPLGELRFKELQPAEHFVGVFNATESGPICPQLDMFYAPIGLVPDPSEFAGEDCIRINVHVPYKFLPDRFGVTKRLLPVLLWIHGGSFSYGSGNAEFYGPEYLMTKEVILVTFNYRIHALGFLSMDNEYIPGNNGLRDCITAMKWVQRNIKFFGGDPGRVTLAGQSAGGVMAHLLSISPATKGLFHQVIGLSGNSLTSFYTYSPILAKILNVIFFIAVGINPFGDPKKIHDELVATPMETLLKGNKVILDLTGLVSFAPVIETKQPGFTTVIPKDPEELLNEGAGKEYPMVIGFTSNEGMSLRKRLEEVRMETTLRLAPALALPQNLIFPKYTFLVPVLTIKHLAEYFSVIWITLDNFVVSATESYYMYPAQRLTQKRLRTGAADTFLYQFAYPGENSPIKIGLNTTFPGASHGKDMAYFFRFNHFLGPQTEDDELAPTTDDNGMKAWMTNFISNFVKSGSPTENIDDWPPSQEDLKFQNIEKPFVYDYIPPTPYMEQRLEYFTALYKLGFWE